MINPFISVIIPAYKESKRIELTLLCLTKYFTQNNYSYEIIVVNDGSPDNTAKIIKAYQLKNHNVVLINNEINKGKGYAVKRGMLVASGEYRLFMDADNSVKIENLDSFLLNIQNGSHIVIGSIGLGSSNIHDDNGWHRRVFGSVSKWLIRLLATPGIYDTQRGFKLFTAKAADIIFPRQTIERFGFDIEVLVIALRNKLVVKEVQVEFNNPLGSTVKLFDYVRTFKELFIIILNKSLKRYDVAPISMKPRTLLSNVLMSPTFIPSSAQTSHK